MSEGGPGDPRGVGVGQGSRTERSYPQRVPRGRPPVLPFGR